MPTSRWERRRARAIAEAIFFTRALRVLIRPIVGLLIVATVGAIVHHAYGAVPGEPAPSWRDAFFVSWCLLFLEHLDPAPPHPAAQAVHYVQPLFGVFLISEGLIKLGISVFRKEQHARAWVVIMAQASRRHVVVCGCGSVGFRVVEELASMGLQIFVVERDPECAFLDRARQLGAEVVIGDARAEDLLRGLNVRQARAVIVTTDDDLANLEIAMDAREMNASVPIVMRLFDQRLAQKVQSSLGIQVSVSTSRLAAPLFASAALDPSVVGAHRVGDALLVVMQVDVASGGQLDGTPIATLRALHGLDVIATRDATDTPWRVQPGVEQVLHAGQGVQLLVPSSKVHEVHTLNAPPG